MKALKLASCAAVVAAGLAGMSTAAHAQTAVDWTQNVGDCPAGGVAGELADEATLKAVEDGLKGGGGFAVVKAHLPELELVVDHAPTSPPQKAVLCDGKVYVRSSAQNSAAVLGDLLQMSALLSDKAASEKMLHGRPQPSGATIIHSPYVMASFYVGAYYNEQHQFDRALVALNKGLAIDPAHPMLVNEAAQAYIQKHQPAPALALCDRALGSGAITIPAFHALLLRTRGLALGDLNRLQEALQSYQESLQYDPSNRGAQNEIRYYQGRLAGAGATATGLTTADKFRNGQPASGSSQPQP